MISVLLSLALLAPAAEIPPSPSEAPGIKIWPAPAFTVWPAVVHPGEVRHGVVSMPVRLAGRSGTLGWAGRVMSVPFPTAEGWIPGQEPPGTPTVGALVELPSTPGLATATTDDGPASIRLIAVDRPWPHADLRDGQAVDAAGCPVVLLAPRHDATAERRFALLADQPVRPTGPALLIGDPLGGALEGLPNLEILVRTDHRGASHPALVAAATAIERRPRSLGWSPGPVIFTRPAEEDRVLGAITERCRALGIAPRLVLLLPEGRPGHDDAPRRQLLAQAAAARGWRVATIEQWAGPNAARLAEGVWAAGPVGEPRERLRRGLTDLLTAP